MEKKIIDEKVNELRELKRMMAELEAEATAIEDSLKAIMTETGADELTGFDSRVTWKTVTSERLDTTALKKLFSKEDLAGYMKVTVSRRFCIA